MNIYQNIDMDIETDADDMLNSLMEYYLSRPKRKQYTKVVIQIKKTHFLSTNSLLGCIGTSPFCPLFASFMEQKAPKTTVSNLIENIHIVKKN